MNTLIKLNENHYVIVDDSEIKIGDWYYDTDDNESLIPIYQRSQDPKFYSGCKKITHSTQPIEEGTTIHEIKHKRWVHVKCIDISEVKELIGEVDVEKKMISPYPMDTQNDVDWCNGYQRGYNQALEDNKEKKYTEEDIKKAIEFGHTSYTPFADVHYSNFIQSLQPKTEWEIEIVNDKVKLI